NTAAAGTGSGFTTAYAGDKLVGPTAVTGYESRSRALPVSAVNNPIWDEAVFSDVRGWPQSGTTDQDRLIITDVPSIQNGIGWSAIDTFFNFAVGTLPEAGMFEILNSQDRIYHVIGGPSAEFVFTDHGVKFIAITETNPLKPGSVAFRDIPSAGAAPVRPVFTPDGVV